MLCSFSGNLFDSEQVDVTGTEISPFVFSHRPDERGRSNVTGGVGICAPVGVLRSTSGTRGGQAIPLAPGTKPVVTKCVPASLDEASLRYPAIEAPA